MVELSSERGIRITTREEVRVALLEAVGLLIQRFGYKKTSVEEIAQEAGVSRATAYLYFANKEAMVLAWVEWRGQRRLDNLRAIAQKSDQSSLGVRERITEVLIARILVAFDEALPYMGTTQGIQGIDELRVALRTPLLAVRERQYEAEADLIAGLLETGKRLGELDPALDSLQCARLLILGTNALLPASLSPQLMGKPAELETLAHGLIALMLNGLPLLNKAP